jgi:hypothetical protein
MGNCFQTTMCPIYPLAGHVSDNEDKEYLNSDNVPLRPSQIMERHSITPTKKKSNEHSSILNILRGAKRADSYIDSD